MSMSPPCTLSALPLECLFQIFSQVSRPSDYACLMQTNSFFRTIGNTQYVRLLSTQQFFAASRSHLKQTSKISWSEETYRAICDFFVTANIHPTYSDIRLAAQQIPTSHFVNYPYPNKIVKRAILDIFRDLAIPDGSEPSYIPKLRSSGSLAQAGAVVHQTANNTSSARRIFYDVVLTKDNAAFPDPFHVWFTHRDAIYAFDSDLNLHVSDIVYKDENLTTTWDFKTLFSFEDVEENNIPILPSTEAAPPVLPGDISEMTVEAIPMPNRLPLHLLRIYTHVSVLTDIKKGGLHPGQKFAYVFVYEQADDLLCVEFCEKVENNGEEGVEPKGYLLLNEFELAWRSQ